MAKAKGVKEPIGCQIRNRGEVKCKARERGVGGKGGGDLGLRRGR